MTFPHNYALGSTEQSLNQKFFPFDKLYGWEFVMLFLALVSKGSQYAQKGFWLRII